MEQLIIGCVISFLVSFYAIPVIVTVANKKKLYDIPDERKIHTTPISSLGGLGIFVGFMLGLLLSINSVNGIGGFQFYIASFMVIFFFGIKDDILVLSPLKKLIGQVMVAAILMFKAGLVITSMHGFLGIHQIDYTLGCFLTLFTIVVVMNAYNLIDGVDGLAGTVSVITSSIFGFFFFVNGDIFFSIMAFTFASSVIGFLIYNYSPAKIFMGDTGAMLSGAVNVILVIRFIETAKSGSVLPILATPAMGFGVLLMPLLDTLRVFSIRMIHGRSPFSPDRNHLHHMLLDRGYNHIKVTSIIAATAILFIVLTYISLPLGTTWIILMQIVLFFTGIYILNVTRPKRKSEMRVIKGEFGDDTGFGKRVKNFVSIADVNEK
ncbi:MAG TPA: MraY family glycosyltransferase [Chitinophagaceae bacterium]|jgi:UDP-N-acetylmuramyl pentapeptide phosphotransferase/UDP-N-acetylglucosamine-1-phosphate transferase|nr:MraY family glycosyltransferase [Chitinophagaceae bacterium]